MIVHPECLPCFMRQALNVAKLVAPEDQGLQRQLVRAFARRLGEADLDRPPPDLAGDLYPLALEITGCADPYLEIKLRSNERVLELLPGLEKAVARASDPLRAALALAVAGNLIDYGTGQSYDWERALTEAVNEDFAKSFAIDDYSRFAGETKNIRILILGDNAGEIVLDTLLVRQLQVRGCQVTYAVRGKPILNDSLMEDAVAVGMTSLCRVVDSGTDAPGAVLRRCAPAFVQEMKEADVVLSKGQGNYEALENNRLGVYYAFKAKCAVVAKQLGVEEEAGIFLYR
jgi:damage-control phosphatase, subfamily I